MTAVPQILELVCYAGGDTPIPNEIVLGEGDTVDCQLAAACTHQHESTHLLRIMPAHKIILAVILAASTRLHTWASTKRLLTLSQKLKCGTRCISMTSPLAYHTVRVPCPPRSCV